MRPETGSEEARHLSERISLSTEAENGNKLGRNRGGQNEFPMGVGSTRPMKKPAGAGVDKCCPPSSGGRPLLSSLPPCPPGPLQPCGIKCHSPSLFSGRSVVGRQTDTARLQPKLQALVYHILPSTTAVFSHAIGPRKLSANEQVFVVVVVVVGAQTVVSLLRHTVQKTVI